MKAKFFFIILGVLFTITSYVVMFDFLIANNYDLWKMFELQFSTNYGKFFLLDLLVTLVVYVYWLITTIRINKKQKIIAFGLIFLIGLAASSCYSAYLIAGKATNSKVNN